ncbi:DUF6233 domain-containing protein [Streptomyces poriferorum]|uniref:DUF6233 domain-containing protein n=1 Tax=Streptomyces poriferorum TaxID=2798799 RepID=A0ABY9J7Q3_9ACTN|nr:MULTISPECIES: DUF6233 domain-containing protein [unclassified Streptomyces]MDP5317390.1 DUF6233 domain-containing protein [Streptomyces sp. Alt4]WLQ61996.1 DUF6233 domain-containing protein [Streptomyces sp. Alt2]
MSEHPSRLIMLQFARRIALQQVDQIDQWIATEERREAERQQGERVRPPKPDWVLEYGIGQGAPPVEVHAGHCYSVGKRNRGITREQALSLLAGGLRACVHCRPDTELGLL